MITELFIDMDCVVSDFMEGMIRRWTAGRVGRHGLERTWELGRYGFGYAVESMYNENGWRRDFTAEQMEERFWRMVRGDATFWANLDKMPWADALMATVRGSGLPYWFLTTPSDCGQCMVGKERWLEKALNEKALPGKLIICQDKWLLGRDGRLLIDDSDRNIDGWREKGGHGLLVPALHNRRCYECDGDESIGRKLLANLNYLLYRSVI